MFSGLVTATVLNTKIGEVQNKISHVNNLFEKIGYDAKIKEPRNILLLLICKDKTKKLVNKSGISNLIKKILKYKICDISNKSRMKSRSR